MKKNIGRADKIIRICLGIFIIVIGINMKSVWGVLGMIPIITSEIGVCPAYLPFGFSTVSKKNK